MRHGKFEDWRHLPAPKRDTACFSDRQWFVGDYAFSTQGDAETAIRLASALAQAAREELADDIRKAIPLY